MNRSTPGLPVHHQLLEFTQTHVHRVSDAIQPSHPLLSPSPPALNPSQCQLIWYPNPTAWYPTDATMAFWGVFFLPNSKIKFRKYLFLSHKLEGSKNSKDWYCNSNQNLLRLILLRSEHQSKSTSITAIFFSEIINKITLLLFCNNSSWIWGRLSLSDDFCTVLWCRKEASRDS